MKNNVKLNPVLKKELRTSMRNVRGSLLVIGYLAVLMLTLCGGLYIQSSYRGMITKNDAIGTFIFLMIVQFALISIISPTIASGAISSEREKQTLDILLTTDMSFLSIITGKLGASLSKIILLIISSTPIFVFLLSYIGINTLGIFGILIINIVAATFVGAIGIYYSTRFKKTIVATVFSYITIFLIYVGPVIMCAMLQVYKYNNGIQFDPAKQFYWYLLISPAVGFMTLIFSQLGISLTEIFGKTLEINFLGITSYMITIIFMIIATILIILLAARKIDPTRKKQNLFNLKKEKKI
ncbi:ABC transporter permease [Clostridium senegalense]|uniref:ABC transporter permease n=1 Tax=Clostridium senegalense TaxID=1465809 RepID=UPI001C10DF89|nr:ABC transporter permease [Clostridium senegalense]MBU5225859.1 ABC transporter permease [Clostridium senegalense]